MKILITIALIAIIFPFTMAGQSAINLFNGKNLKGWKVLNGTAVYTIVNNEIVGTSKLNSSNTFLATEKLYTNFVLEYDMKMGEGLNSGVQIRSSSLPTYKEGRVHGIQIECDDSQRAWSGGIYDEARKGWRYPVEYNPEAKAAYQKGEWNHFKVVAFQNHIVPLLMEYPLPIWLKSLLKQVLLVYKSMILAATLPWQEKPLVGKI